MDIISHQKIIPDYAHQMILLLLKELRTNCLLTNKKIINSINLNIKYLISFYLGKRTQSKRRAQSIQEIQSILKIITSFSKIKLVNTKSEHLEQLKVVVNKVCLDLELNQKG